MSPQARMKIAALDGMRVRQLRELFEELFGEVPRSNNKVFLTKRIAWRIQALEEGDLSERARQRAMEIANDADLRIKAPAQRKKRVESEPPPSTERGTVEWGRDARVPLPGTILKRRYKGRMVQAMVLESGFEFEGEVFDSLSALATKAAGTRWNGYAFFGLNRKESCHAN